MSTIAVLGNHAVDFCTERELDWTLEKMDHNVIRLQENNVSAIDVIQSCRERGAKLMLWIHTHGWTVQGNLYQMLDQLKKSGIKTASFHLDRFWGLRQLDQREDRIGDHAFFRTDKFFSADGGNDEKWASRGINHVWLKAGVVERDCVFGKPNLKFNCPVAFFGADGYHPEHPFRMRMISRLREKYGTNFRVYQGIRQQELNDAYATIKVIVGDHCFAGQPRYCSDRLYETTGRGGFLIYPKTEGITDEIPGLVTYKPQDVDDLISKIDYWLDDDRNIERIRRRNEAHEYVKRNCTYTQRMQSLLQIMEIK
jgi:Glycosyl transferases group 1